MDGILYMLNQAGMALAQAQAEIERLTEENESLKKDREESEVRRFK